MGAGQGFAQGVEMAGGFLMPALQQRARLKQYQAQLEQQNKQYYDRLALSLQDMRDEQRKLYGMPVPQDAGYAQAPPDFQWPVPYQSTRDQTSAELLAGQFSDPRAQIHRPSAAPLAWSSPIEPARPVPRQPATSTQSYARPQASLSTYQGPAPSATPFSSASSSPYTEQRTFSQPRDPSMVIGSMEDVTHSKPEIMRMPRPMPLPQGLRLRQDPELRRGY